MQKAQPVWGWAFRIWIDGARLSGDSVEEPEEEAREQRRDRQGEDPGESDVAEGGHLEASCAV